MRNLKRPPPRNETMAGNTVWHEAEIWRRDAGSASTVSEPLWLFPQILGNPFNPRKCFDDRTKDEVVAPGIVRGATAECLQVRKKLLEKRMTRTGMWRPDFAWNDTGATAVEFAMVAPVFFLVLGAIVETGLMLFTEYVLQSSVQEAARQVRTGQAQSAGMSAGTFKNEVCDMASIVLNCASDVSVYVRSEPTFTALKAAVPSYLSVGASYGGGASVTSYDCGTPSEAVAIIATYDWDFVMPGMSAFGNVDSNGKRRLAGFAMFRNEPFPAGTACS